MGINAKKIFGIITTVAILGVTIYTIKKYYDSKKQDEKAIDLEEAKRIVEDGDRDYVDAHVYHKTKGLEISDDEMEGVKHESREEAHYDPTPTPKTKRRAGNRSTLSDDQMEGIVDEARDEANWNASFTNANVVEPERPIAVKPEDVKTGHDLEDEEEEEAFYELPDPQEVQDSKGYFEKEVNDDLRYDPNSTEAREQFINMELASLGRDNDTRDVIAMLYDHPFVPTCDEDQNLKTRLIDHRIKFFGLVSRWTKEVTYGDVVMYYGKAAEYNCNEDVRHWVDYFLTCADINDIMLTSDEFDERIKLLNAHTFFNEELQSYGLFGLSSVQMNEAEIVAHQRIDENITYDIEFNQFVQGVI